MTVSYPPARPVLQFTGGNVDQQLRTTAAIVTNIMNGQLNTTIFVTLDAGSATTTVMDPRISAQTTVAFCPTSANAAAEIPTLWAELSNKQLILHHTNSVSTDRTFNMGLIG